MSDYQFVSVWNIAAPVNIVWDIIHDADSWPKWWKGVIRSVELNKGDPEGLGSVRRTAWKSALPYVLEFDSEITRIEHHRLIEARAFGELEGKGLWQFFPEIDGSTRIQYDWTVNTTKAWMNIIAPVARPIFRWNHDVIMRWGEVGLKKRLAEMEEG